MASPATEELLVFFPPDVVNVLPLVLRTAHHHLKSHFLRYAALSLLFVSPIASLPILSCYFFSGDLSSPLPLAVVGVVLLLLLSALSILSAIFGVLIITYFMTIDCGFICDICPTSIPAAIKHLLSHSFSRFLITAFAGFAQIAAVSLPFSAVIGIPICLFLQYFLHIDRPFIVVSSVSIFVSHFFTSSYLLPKQGLAPAISLLEKKPSFRPIRKSDDTLIFNGRLTEAYELYLRRMLIGTQMLLFWGTLYYVIFSDADPSLDSVGFAVFLAAAATICAGVTICNFAVGNCCLFLHTVDPEDDVDAYDQSGNPLRRSPTAEKKGRAICGCGRMVFTSTPICGICGCCRRMLSYCCPVPMTQNSPPSLGISTSTSTEDTVDQIIP